VEVRTRTRSREGKEEVERIHRFVDADGNQVKIVVKIETEDGKTETINKRTITDQNGVEVVIRTKTELRDDRERVTHSIEVNGIEVPTKLSVREEIKNNRSRMKAKLSTGAEQDIIFLPDEALQVAFDELTSQNITIELREITEGNTVKAVFSAKTIKPGRLLGIFNTQVNLETLIDTETGEIIKTNRPFWAFLVIGENNTTLCHIPPGNPDNRKTLTVGIPAVKAHLGHGDSLDACVSVCGDGILVEGEEICEGDIRDCSTAEGYLGTETCNAACDGFDSCVAVESCGDGFINGPETCDDTNAIDGDGCDAACQIEATGNGTTTP
jgi:cysteine-rich repeat protein